MIRNAVGKHARVQMATDSRAPSQHAPEPPMSMPRAPHVPPPLHQLRPSMATTPYQQAVQVPGKSTGRGITVKPPSDKAAPAAGQTTQDCRRQQTRGWGDRGRSASCPGVHEEQHQMFPLLTPWKSLHLNEAAVPRPRTLTLCCWQRNSAAVGGGETLSTCSRSTISTAYKPPIGRLNGRE